MRDFKSSVNDNDVSVKVTKVDFGASHALAWSGRHGYSTATSCSEWVLFSGKSCTGPYANFCRRTVHGLEDLEPKDGSAVDLHQTLASTV